MCPTNAKQIGLTMQCFPSCWISIDTAGNMIGMVDGTRNMVTNLTRSDWIRNGIQIQCGNNNTMGNVTIQGIISSEYDDTLSVGLYILIAVISILLILCLLFIIFMCSIAMVVIIKKVGLHFKDTDDRESSYLPPYTEIN
jgi:hypothetical protein